MFLLGLDPTKPLKPEDEESTYIFKARLMSQYIDDSDDEIDELCKEIEQSPDVIAIENQAMEVIELSSDEETEVDKVWKDKLSQSKDPSPPPTRWKPVPGCRFPPIPESSSPHTSDSPSHSVRPCYVRLRKISADLIDDDEPAKASRTHKGSLSSKGKRTSKSRSKTKNRNSLSDSKSPRNSKENLKQTTKHLPKQSSPESSSNESKSSSNSGKSQRRTKKRDSDRSPIRSSSELKHNRVKENEKQSLNNIKKLAALVDPDLEPIVLKPLKTKKKKIVKKAAADAATTDERECVRSSNPGKLIIRRKSIAEVMEAKVAKVSAAVKPSTRTSEEPNERITNGISTDAVKQVLSKYKIPKISSNMVDKPEAGAKLNGSTCPYDFNEDDVSSPVEVKKPRDAMPPRRMTFCSGGDQSSSFLPFYPRKPVAIVEAQPIPKRRSSVYDPNPEKKAPKRRMSISEPKAAKSRRLSTIETDDDMFKKASAMRDNTAKMPHRRVSTDEYKSKSEIATIQKHRAQKLKEVALKNKPELGASTSKQLEPKNQQERAVELVAIAAKTKIKVTTKNRGDFLTELEPAAASKPPMKLPEVISKAANASNIEKVKGANDSKIDSIRQKYIRTNISSATVNDGVAEDIQFRPVEFRPFESRWNQRFSQPIVPMVPSQPAIPPAGFYNQIQFSQEENFNLTLPAPEPTSPSAFPVSILKHPQYSRPRLNRSVSFKPDQDLVAVKCYELDSEEPDVYDGFAFQLNPTVPLQPRRYSLPEFQMLQPIQSFSEYKMRKSQLYPPLPNTP